MPLQLKTGSCKRWLGPSARYISSLVCYLLLCGALLTAEVPKRNPIFEVPDKLRPRVNFWIDVFAVYSRDHALVHHRNFPQAVFEVLDLRDARARMSDGQYARYRKSQIKQAVARVRSAVLRLSSGQEPNSRYDRQIASAMELVPGGKGKFQELLRDDLIRTQSGIREKFGEAVARSGRYLPIMERIFVQEYDLPRELTRMPFIESSFDYRAYSAKGAAGIWQFMPRTGRLYLTINRTVDERRDPIEATRAAAKYLKYAYQKVRTWPLAITSYNHGPYGVAKKVKEFESSDIVQIVEHPTKRVFGFASTNFYPEFLAALEVYDRHTKYFPDIEVEEPRFVFERKLPSSVSVRSLVAELGIPATVLREYNLGLASRVWSGYYNVPKGYRLKVPRRIEKRLASLSIKSKSVTAPAASSVYGGVVYRVRRGDTLSSIARHYKTSVSKLKSLNNLKNDLVRVGQTLVVRPRSSGDSTSTTVAGSSTTYRVRSGDTLSGLAARFGTRISDLRQWNDLRSSRIYVGQRLTVRKAGAPSPVNTPSEIVRHRVRSGENLTVIGRRYGVSASQIREWNNLRGNRIYAGQWLQIRVGAGSSAGAPEVYHVRRGDSLWSIGRKFGISIARLKSANGLRSSKLRVGQTLQIP